MSINLPIIGNGCQHGAAPFHRLIPISVLLPVALPWSDPPTTASALTPLPVPRSVVIAAVVVVVAAPTPVIVAIATPTPVAAEALSTTE